MFLYNLAGVLKIRAERESPLPDLLEALTRAQDAQKSMLEGNPAQARVLWQLGRLLDLDGASKTGGVVSMVADGVP